MWNIRLLSASQHCLAGCDSPIVVGNELLCSNRVWLHIIRCAACVDLFHRLDQWVWIQMWSIVISNRRRRISVLQSESIVGEKCLKEAVNRCRGLQLGGQSMQIRPQGMAAEYVKRSLGKLTLSDACGSVALMGSSSRSWPGSTMVSNCA
jgi:hypothetical protein